MKKLQFLIARVFGKKVISIDVMPDITCEVVGYWIKDNLYLTKCNIYRTGLNETTNRKTKELN